MGVSVLFSVRRVRKAFVTSAIFTQEWFVTRVYTGMYTHVLHSRKSFPTVADFTAEGSFASMRPVMIDELVASAKTTHEARTAGPRTIVRFCRVS